MVAILDGGLCWDCVCPLDDFFIYFVDFGISRGFLVVPHFDWCNQCRVLEQLNRLTCCPCARECWSCCPGGVVRIGYASVGFFLHGWCIRCFWCFRIVWSKCPHITSDGLLIGNCIDSPIVGLTSHKRFLWRKDIVALVPLKLQIVYVRAEVDITWYGIPAF